MLGVFLPGCLATHWCIVVLVERELWDRHEVAAYLGIKVGSANAWLTRHDVRPVDRRPVGRGALANLYDAADVRAAKAAAPGSGYRSDLD